ncbi:kinase-like domain-containing protein [Zopfochytrium polystomum]|nr:kinase-like domain-containing protein [Zopfochytrium polystomum]
MELNLRASISVCLSLSSSHRHRPRLISKVDVPNRPPLADCRLLARYRCPARAPRSLLNPSHSSSTSRTSKRHRSFILKTVKPLDSSMDSAELANLTISSRDIAREPALIGAGGFGQVFRGTYQRHIPVAIKQFQVEATGIHPATRRELLAEARIIKECRTSGVSSPFIIGFYGLLVEENGAKFSLVMELASVGSLFDYYRKTDISLVPVDHRISLLHQVSVGMSFLHGLEILHNDLKSMNVLLTQSGPNTPLVAKIADFGLSKMKNEIRSRTTLSHVGGSTYWMAPELTGFKKKITKANDVFSFAVLLTEVVSWVGVYGVPLHEMDPSQFPLASKDDNYRREALADLDENVFTAIKHGRKVRDLFQQCWQADPAARPLFPQIASTLELLLDGFDGAQAVASSVATPVFHPVPAAAANPTMPKPTSESAAQGEGSLGYYSEGYMAQTLMPSFDDARGSGLAQSPMTSNMEKLSLQGPPPPPQLPQGIWRPPPPPPPLRATRRLPGDSAHEPSKPSPPPGPVDEILTDLALTHPDTVKFWRHWAVDAATGKTAFQMPWSELVFALEAAILNGDPSKEVKEDLLQQKCGKAFQTACPLSAFSVFVKRAPPGSTVADVFGFAVGPTKQELRRIKEKEKQSCLEDKVKHRIVAGGWDQASCTFKELTEAEKMQMHEALATNTTVQHLKVLSREKYFQ